VRPSYLSDCGRGGQQDEDRRSRGHKSQ
jgi:hypothetical protein